MRQSGDSGNYWGLPRRGLCNLNLSASALVSILETCAAMFGCMLWMHAHKLQHCTLSSQMDMICPLSRTDQWKTADDADTSWGSDESLSRLFNTRVGRRLLHDFLHVRPSIVCGSLRQPPNPLHWDTMQDMSCRYSDVCHKVGIFTLTTIIPLLKFLRLKQPGLGTSSLRDIRH